ncbi:MAG: hypothetical protein K2G31_00880, partial [Clostridia bacterium]|nr:hypothetical protein [Clostridia bacterium]
MNIMKFTFKLTYENGSKPCMLTLDSDELAKGYQGELFSLALCGSDERVKITLSPKAPIALKLAEVIYDRYFENNERFFSNGFQSWTTSREYSRGDEQKGLHPICQLPFARKYAAPSGDYDFVQYGKNLFHSFTYCYIRNGEK